MPKFFAASPNYSMLAAPAVAYGGGVWVVVFANTQTALTSSDNGATWISRQLPVTANWFRVIYANGRFMAFAGGTAAGASGSNMCWSLDGILWVMANTSPAACWWKGIAYDGTVATYKTVMVGGAAAATTGTLCSRSSDGAVTWGAAATLNASAEWIDVASSGAGRFVAIAGGTAAGTLTGYSTDGNNWSAGGARASSQWVSIAYGSSKFLAVS